MSSCCLAVGLAVHEMDATAEVHEVEALAQRAWDAFALDAYAMSAAVMFAQVWALAGTQPRVPAFGFACVVGL